MGIWGWIVLRGVVALLFGVVAIARPDLTLQALVIVWGAYALSDGLLALVAGFRFRPAAKPMWALVLVGLLGIGAGIGTFMQPGMTALVLLSFIGVWALIIGILQIMVAIRLRKVIANEWMMILSGLLAAAFGGLMLVRPGAGALAVVWLIGWYSIAFGALLTMLGFRLKGHSAPAVPKPA